MKAVVYRNAGAIDRLNALEDAILDKPSATGRDLLVRVRAVSVNPVDTKLRSKRPPESAEGGVLGYDASGVVEAVGPDVCRFKVGEEVFYAGAINRPGTNSEFHLVDERIAGHKPGSLSHAEAAALPLTAITAWEMLFDRLRVNTPPVQGSDLILVVGGAGGVGSIAIQLIRALTELTVIATASRAETQEWVRQCGAHYVIDHAQALAPQIAELGLGAPGFVFSTTHTDQHLEGIIEAIAAQGRLGLIDDPVELDARKLKQKAISLHWEFMFTRSLFGTPDVDEQGKLLDALAILVDEGKIRTTLTEVAGRIDAATLSRVHRTLESGKTRGKIVLEGF